MSAVEDAISFNFSLKRTQIIRNFFIFKWKIQREKRSNDGGQKFIKDKRKKNFFFFFFFTIFLYFLYLCMCKPVRVYLFFQRRSWTTVFSSFIVYVAIFENGNMKGSIALKNKWNGYASVFYFIQVLSSSSGKKKYFACR